LGQWVTVVTYYSPSIPEYVPRAERIAIPAAAGLFVPRGIDLPMSVGAAAMSLSTIIVAANAQLLRRSSHEVVIHDLQKSETASKAKSHGVRSTPAIVIDGELASCCAGRGPEQHGLLAALG
jgi:hypothetical protein